MAASTGGENIEETPSVEITSKLPNNLTQIAEKTEEVSTNGTGSCSSFAAARKGPYTLRPSLFSSNSASGSAVPAFGSHTTPQFSSLNPPFNLSPRKNPIILRPSVFGSASDTEKDVATRRPVVLKSSQLGSVTNSAISTSTCSNASSFVLSPAKLNNPFHKTAYDNGSTVTSTSSETTSISSQESEKENPLKLSSEAPKVSFVPLASSACSSTSAQSPPQAPPGATTTVPTFVFGQNLHERVEALPEAVRGEAECSGAAPPTITSTCDGEVSKANGVRWDSDMVFSRFIEQELPDKQSEGANDERKRKSLSEAAREYEESRAVKRKYEEVKVKTGEEEEINILQMNCKLFAFNKEKSNWMERGRGTLRLNDLSVENKTQSRVVMRVSGSLRVVLNTKIWAEMTVDRPSDKSVRLTAMDSSGEIKVFLVMAGVKEIDQLYRALEWRVNNQKKLVASASEKRTETNVS